jgi:nucleoside-diphosphate-sugar epimerase
MDLRFYEGKKVLLTGHTGFKGSWMSVTLVNAGAEVLMQLVANSEITVDPDAAEQMLYQMTTTYQAQADMYGFAFEDFLSYFLGMTPEDLENYASEIVKQEMVLQALIEKEKLSATDEQKDMVARMNGFADAKALLEQIDAEAAENVFSMGAANYFLLENSVAAE